MIFEKICFRGDCFLKRFSRTMNTKVIISAHGRGGSTWLAEVLSSIPNTLHFNEPLSRKHQYLVGGVDLGKYYFPSSLNDNLEHYLKMLFYDDYWNRDMIVNYSLKNSILTSKISLMKFIRLNPMLPFLEKLNEKTKLKLLILNRNPYDTILSQINYSASMPVGVEWDNSEVIPEYFFQYPELEDYRDLMKSINSRVQKLAFIFAINQKAQKECEIGLKCDYDLIRKNPELELSRILRYLDLEESLLNKLLRFISTPSTTVIAQKKLRALSSRQKSEIDFIYNELQL